MAATVRYRISQRIPLSRIRGATPVGALGPENRAGVTLAWRTPGAPSRAEARSTFQGEELHPVAPEDL